MDEDIEIKHIIDKIRSLAGNNPEAGFGVPGDYFEELPGKIDIHLHHETYVDPPLNIKDLKPGWPGSAPTGYFESFAARLDEKINESENAGRLKKVAAPDESFGVPAGYFGKSFSEILDKTIHAPARSVIHDIRQAPSSAKRIGILRIVSVAAMLFIAFGLGWMLKTGQNDGGTAETDNHPATTAQVNFNDLSADELIQAIGQSDPSEELLAQFASLPTSDAAAGIKSPVNPGGPKNNIDSKIKELSKEEIQNSLNESADGSLITDEL